MTPEDALLLLGFDLGLGYVLLRGCDLHVDGGYGSGEGDLGCVVCLARVQVAGYLTGGEALGGDGEVEGAGWDIGEEEAAVAAGDDDALG